MFPLSLFLFTLNFFTGDKVFRVNRLLRNIYSFAIIVIDDMLVIYATVHNYSRTTDILYHTPMFHIVVSTDNTLFIIY